MGQFSNKIVVAGGGAAGMMAAIAAARDGAGVVLLEPNEKVGRKLYITGKGRCNVTNNCGRDFTAKLARNLLKDGFTIIDIKPDRTDKDGKRSVFVFRNENHIEDKIKEYK